MAQSGSENGTGRARAARRRLVIDVMLLLCGITFLTSLYMLSDNPLLRRGIWVLVAWQGGWYLVRALLMVRIWRRETALSAGRKVWMALTMPVAGLFAIWAGRGALSSWLTSTEESAS